MPNDAEGKRGDRFEQWLRIVNKCCSRQGVVSFPTPNCAQSYLILIFHPLFLVQTLGVERLMLHRTAPLLAKDTEPFIIIICANRNHGRIGKCVLSGFGLHKLEPENYN